MRKKEKQIKAFLHNRMYRAPSVMVMRENASTIVGDLFKAYFEHKAEMPEGWSINPSNCNAVSTAQEAPRMVADFIAGMTDRYAILEHQRLFDETPDLG